MRTASHNAVVLDQYNTRASAYVNSAVHAAGEDLDLIAQIVANQRDIWHIIPLVVSFVIYVITMVGETKTITILDYGETLQDNELQVFVADNHYNQSDDYFAIFRIIGTDGHITGTLGAMYNYPHGREDTLEWSSKRFYKDKRFEAKLEGKWIPDAFIGPTASLMQAIQEDGAPETDAADNLNTLRIVEACYVSAAEHRSVRLDELPAVSDWGK